MKIAAILIAGALALSLGACEGQQYGQKQTGGAILGGIGGGLLGELLAALRAGRGRGSPHRIPRVRVVPGGADPREREVPLRSPALGRRHTRVPSLAPRGS